MAHEWKRRPDPQIEVGQTWKRARDGVLVEITAYDIYWDDARYKKVGASRGRGRIFGDYLRARYRLIESPAPSTPSADGAPAEPTRLASGSSVSRDAATGGASHA